MSTALISLFLLGLNIVNGLSAMQIPIDRCKGDIVNCAVAPCQNAKCDKYPDAVCVNDYCNGCNARFFDPSDKEFENELQCSYVFHHT